MASMAFLAGVAQAEDLNLSGTTQSVSANKQYGTVTVSGDSRFDFGRNNKNLIIDSLNIGEGASLSIDADICDLVVIESLSGSGDLTLNRTQNDENWSYSVALKGDGAGYTGAITTVNNANAQGNSMQLYLMTEDAARNAAINLGARTTLGVSTATAKVAGLNGTAANAAVISFANPNATQDASGLNTNSGNCYNQNASRETNDATRRTLVLTGSGEYSYAGRIGSQTYDDTLNLTVALTGDGTQTLSGTNYLNDLTVTSGNLTLSGNTTVDHITRGDYTVQNGTLTINGSSGSTATFGNVQVRQGGALVLHAEDSTGWDNHGSASIHLQGESGNVATLRLDAHQTTSIDITLAGHARIESNVTSKSALDMYDGTIYASGVDNEINAIISTRKDATYNVAESGTLTINGKFVTSSDGSTEPGHVTKEGAGKLTLASAEESLFRDGITVSAGELELATGSVSTISSDKSLSISAGSTLTIAGRLNMAGATFSNSGTIAMQAGALVDFGAYADSDTFEVGTMTGFNQDMLYGLGGRQTATYADGVITISGSVGDMVWNGTADSHVWNKSTDNRVWLNGGNADYFWNWDNVTFDARGEGVSETVTMTETVDVSSITVNGAYTFEMSADNAFANIDGAGTFTKTGAATLSLGQIPTANLVVSEGAAILEPALGATADASSIKVTEGGTLKVSLSNAPEGTQLDLNGASDGTVEVLQGRLRVDGARKSTVGSGKIVLNDGAGLTFASSDINLVSTVSNAIEVKDGGTAILQTWGNANLTADNKLTGAITGSGTLKKTDGGKLTISGDMSGFTGSILIEAHSENSNRLVLDTNATLAGLAMDNGTTLTVSGAGHTVTIGAQAADLNVMGDGVTISSSGQARTINAGAGATLRDNRYLLLNGGTLNVGGGGTVEVFGISLSSDGSNATTVNIDAGTTMHIFGTSNDASAGNKAAFSLSHWNAANSLNVSGTLISDAAIVSIAGPDASLNVKNGGELVMRNGLLGYERDSDAMSVINVENGGTLSVGSADANSSAALTVNMAAGSTIKAYDGEGGNSADGNSIVGQTLTLGTGDGVVNFSAASGKTLTIKSLTGDRGINITGTGTVALDGLTLSNALSVEAGSTLSLKGNVTISKAIDSDGTVSLAEGGRLALAGIAGLEETSGNVTYSDDISGSTQNGYINASYIVVKGSGTVTVDAVTLYGEEHALTESGGNRIVTLNGTCGDYYVNGDTVVYGGTGANANDAAGATGIVLNGGSLEMQRNLADGVNITLAANGTVSLDSEVTLSSDRVARNGHSLTLGGTGKFIHQQASGDFSLSQYDFADDWNGTVELQAKSGTMNLNENTSKSYKGTMVLNFGGHIVIGEDSTTTNSIFGENTHLVLNAGTSGQAMILSNQYTDKVHALTLASLSSGADGTAVSHIRGDWGGNASSGNRYLKVKQNSDTTFAGIFYQVEEKGRDVGLIKDGSGNLTLTGASTSGADLDVNGGTVTLKDGGNWAGAINVGSAGTLAFNGADKVIAADKNITFDEGATLAVTGGCLTIRKADLSLPNLAISGDGVLKVSSGNSATVTADGITARANSAEGGTAKKVTLNADGITGATAGEGDALQSLGEMSCLTLAFAAESTPALISNVTMRDVTLTASDASTIAYTNATAVAATARGGAEAPALYAATLAATPQTLTAMAVQKGGTATGTLTIDMTSELLNDNFGRTLEWTFLDQVTLGSDFKVELGDILAGIVSDGSPEVWLTVGDRERELLTAENIDNITVAAGGLLNGTTGPVNVTLTVDIVPEPSTATLSLLALAALAARRRRK